MFTRATKQILTLLLSITSIVFFALAFAKDEPSTDHQYDVIIIGAGAAGLGAAQELYQHGTKDVLVIEARDRIGGRVWTINPWGTATDLGASWIMHADNSPLAIMAKEYDVKTMPTVYGHDLSSKFSSFDIYDSQGKKITPEELQAGRKLIDTFLNEYFNNKGKLSKNASMEDALSDFALQHHLNGKALQIFHFMAKDMLESELAGDLTQLPYDMSPFAHTALTGKYVLPEGGYIRLFSELVKNIPISLNNPVTSIHYGPEGVTILAKEGVYHAKRAIVTLPLGVLKADTVKFSPELPKEKRDSIKRMNMGVFNKVYLLFEQPFWNSDSEWIAMIPSDKKPKEHYEILNLYKYVHQPILLFFSAGSFSVETEGWTDKAIVDDTMQKLKLIYGRDIPSPSAYLITRWSKDPFARGSYSHPAIGASIQDAINLAAPVANQLFFAGEATSTTDPSTVHGAYMSGVAAAQLVMKQ